MTSPYHTTGRLIDEYLDALMAVGWQLDNIGDDSGARIVRLQVRLWR